MRGPGIGGPKMSGNFVRERQRIVYVYNIHVYYICKQYVAARARNFQTFLGRLWSRSPDIISNGFPFQLTRTRFHWLSKFRKPMKSCRRHLNGKTV